MKKGKLEYRNNGSMLSSRTERNSTSDKKTKLRASTSNPHLNSVASCDGNAATLPVLHLQKVKTLTNVKKNAEK